MDLDEFMANPELNFGDLFLHAILDDNLPEAYILSDLDNLCIEDELMYMLEIKAAESGTLVDTEFRYH